MTDFRAPGYLLSLVNELRSLPRETEWLEFKVNEAEPTAIGTCRQAGRSCLMGIRPARRTKRDGGRKALMANGLGSWQLLDGCLMASRPQAVGSRQVEITLNR